ncbi:hypothetical protein [Desulforapulum autotrophicum]|uniref:hypothetical protein n=1 Tax=Desulforapulum autotrophicum TaxID=2296 RepID=UPI0011D163A6|nr:hypothetical protein [Desulforapulum autotrophicum]
MTPFLKGVLCQIDQMHSSCRHLLGSSRYFRLGFSIPDKLMIGFSILTKITIIPAVVGKIQKAIQKNPAAEISGSYYSGSLKKKTGLSRIGESEKICNFIFFNRLIILQPI